MGSCPPQHTHTHPHPHADTTTPVHTHTHTHTCLMQRKALLLPTFPGRDRWCELWRGNTKTISSHMLLLQLLFQLDILTLCPLILEIMRRRRRVSCVRTVQETMLSWLYHRTVPWFRKLVTSLSPRRHGFVPRPVHGIKGGQSSKTTGPPHSSIFPSISFHLSSTLVHSLSLKWYYLIWAIKSVVK